MKKSLLTVIFIVALSGMNLYSQYPNELVAKLEFEKRLNDFKLAVKNIDQYKGYGIILDFIVFGHNKFVRVSENLWNRKSFVNNHFKPMFKDDVFRFVISNLQPEKFTDSDGDGVLHKHYVSQNKKFIISFYYDPEKSNFYIYEIENTFLK